MTISPVRVPMPVHWAAAGLLTADELQRMEDALDELQRRVDSGAFAPIEDDEDEAHCTRTRSTPDRW